MPLDDNFCTFSFSRYDADVGTVVIAETTRRQPAYVKRSHRTVTATDGRPGVLPRAYLATLDDPFCLDKTYGEVQGILDPSSELPEHAKHRTPASSSTVSTNSYSTKTPVRIARASPLKTPKGSGDSTHGTLSRLWKTGFSIVLRDPEECITFVPSTSPFSSTRFKFEFASEQFRVRRTGVLAHGGPSNLNIVWKPRKLHCDDPCIVVAQVQYTSSSSSSSFRRTRERQEHGNGHGHSNGIRSSGTGLATVTLIDYNIERLGILDKKGFEVLVLLLLTTLHDIWAFEGHRVPMQMESARVRQFSSSGE